MTSLQRQTLTRRLQGRRQTLPALPDTLGVLRRGGKSMEDQYGTRPRVLSFGHDQSLLVTRQLLLEKSGHSVVCATNTSEFRTLVLRTTFDLILLCQSISSEECESASRFAREYAPEARLLLMFVRVGKCVPDHADVLLDAQAGPKVFLETTQRILTGRAVAVS